jgi:ferric-dicitrate binding protein FerR (iron transport regulator)
MKFMKSILTVNRKEAEELVAKYYLGETTQQEEKLLSEFLEQDGSALFLSEKTQFKLYKYNKELKASKLLKERIETELNTSISLFPFKSIFKIAAILVLGTGIMYSALNYYDNQVIKILTKEKADTKVMLPDGSIVWIDNFSEFSYPKKFSNRGREVSLKGQAYFEVTKDTKRPFTIQTANADMKVIGTSFNIRSYREEDDLELTVYTGKVLFESEKKIEVDAGSQLVLRKKDKQVVQSRLKNLNSLAWRGGQLKFENYELKEVFHDLGRCFGVKFIVEDTAILKCHFNGTFFEPKLLEVLEIIKYTLNIEYEKSKNVIYIRGNGCAKSQ